MAWSRAGNDNRLATTTVVHASSSSSSSDDDDDVTTRSNYKETSGAVKGLVSGLTAIVNAFGGSKKTDDDDEGAATRRERREARALPAKPRDPMALRDDIALEFTEAKYLWTGDITPEMYDLFCTFTDPTLSFAGLDTFTKNLENLQPILSRLVRDSDVELYSCRLLGEESESESESSRGEDGRGNDTSGIDASGTTGTGTGTRVDTADGDGDRDGSAGAGAGAGGIGKVQASWRMTGNLRLPWKPRIDLRGRTTFTFKDNGPARGCLITAYQEEWELSAAEAVSQLAKPLPW